jgi:hypothetical protein
VATSTLTGTTGNDILNAPGTVNTDLVGLAGNDTLTLIKAGDAGNAGAGDDSITLNVSGEANNQVVGGVGNDSLFVLTGVTSFNGNAQLGEGNDRYVNTGVLANGATLSGNVGDDTISLGGNVINTFVGLGQGSDSLALIGSSTVTNSTVFGGKGADTITVSAQIATISTIQASDGHDLILATAFTGSTVLAGGKGADSITLGTAGGTINGGGLADTISFAGIYQGGLVYGDANGTKKVGTGTGGAADGNDSITFSAATIAAGASIYGGGGNDTVLFAANASSSALVLDGGNGADLLGSTATDFAATAGSILGGGGFDVIKMISGESGLFIDGGLGGDSIYILSAGEGTSVNGGAGDDTVTMGVVSASTAAGLVTINGGAGADVINLGITALSANAGAKTATTAIGTIATADLLGQIVYSATSSSGDVITLNVTGVSTTLANFLVGVPAIGYGGSVFSTALVSTFSGGAGSIAVYDTDGLAASDGDLVIAVYGAANSSINFINIIGGDALLKTTSVSVGTSFGMNSSNIGFTAAGTSSALTITIA